VVRRTTSCSPSASSDRRLIEAPALLPRRKRCRSLAFPPCLDLEEEDEIEPYTVDEIKAILAEAGKHRNAARWAAALALGLRQGAALGLKWSDVDMKTGVLRVPDMDYREWKQILRTAGIRDGRLHDARHPAATVLLLLGVPERAVMDVMGWSSSSMVKRYQHVTAPVRMDIAERVGGLLWAATEAAANDDPDGGAAGRSCLPEQCC
jgi:hypothetical protein